MKVLINSLKELLTLQKKQHQTQRNWQPRKITKICAKGTPDVIDKTKKQHTNDTYLALSYGSREELVAAVRNICSKKII
jgi:undecaprenyl diphosphate synthase